jgi:hypothetical protein
MAAVRDSSVHLRQLVRDAAITEEKRLDENRIA